MQSPEPRIGYGAFDYAGRPLLPGTAQECQIGYGILNLPSRLNSSYVTLERNEYEDRYLNEYLEQARTAWELDGLLEKYEATPDKLQLLVGLEVGDVSLYTESMTLTVKPRQGSGATSLRYKTVTIDFGHSCISYGLADRDTIRRQLAYEYLTIKAIDSATGVWTMANDFQFAVLPRLRDDTPIVLSGMTDEFKADLMRIQAKREAERDSQPSPTLQ